MTGNTLFEAVSYITHDLVEKASDAFESRTKKYRNILFAKRISVSAVSCACAVLLILGVLSQVFVYTFSPKYDGRFTSSEINSRLPSYLSSEIIYETESVPKGEAPDTLPLPKKDYAFVYRYRPGAYFSAVYQGTNYDMKEMEKYTEKKFKSLSKYLGVSVPEYTIYEPEDYHGELLLAPTTYEVDMDGYEVRIDQGSSSYGVTMEFESSGAIPSLKLNGKEYFIDVTKGNESIKKDVLAFAPVLYKMFGEKFEHIRVSSHKADYSLEELGEYNSYATIVLYNKTGLVFETEEDILWNYLQIKIEVDHVERTYNVSFSYVDYRISIDEKYENLGASKIISLDEAVEKAKKGHTFGSHSWQALKGEEVIDFSDYDYVSYEYYHRDYFKYSILSKYTWSEKNRDPIIPYYVFYKLLKTNAKSDIYAKAYIPAIPVGDSERYFTNHNAISDTPPSEDEIQEILKNATVIAFDMYDADSNYAGELICEDEYYSFENQQLHTDNSVDKNISINILGEEYYCEYVHTVLGAEWRLVHVYKHGSDGKVWIDALTNKPVYFTGGKSGSLIFNDNAGYKKVIETKIELIKQWYPEYVNTQLFNALENSKNQKEYTDNLARINDYYNFSIDVRSESATEYGISEFNILGYIAKDTLSSETKRKIDAFSSQAVEKTVTEKVREIFENSQIPDPEKVKYQKFEITPYTAANTILLKDGTYGVYYRAVIRYLYEYEDGEQQKVFREIGIILK